MQHKMVFAGGVIAFFGDHLLALGIKQTEDHFGSPGQPEAQLGHFDERIGRILEQFYLFFGQDRAVTGKMQWWSIHEIKELLD